MRGGSAAPAAAPTLYVNVRIGSVSDFTALIALFRLVSLSGRNMWRRSRPPVPEAHMQPARDISNAAGNQEGLIAIYQPSPSSRKVAGSSREVLRKRGNIMIYHILFWTLCAVLAAHVAVALIAITRAYRNERRLAFLNGTPNLKRGKILS